MELLALSESLQMVEGHHLLPIEINIDSLEVLSMLSSGNFFYNATIDDYRSKLRKLENFMIFHCHREQNGVVDALAKLMADSEIQLETTFFKVSPMCTHHAVLADIVETYFVRTVKDCNNSPQDGTQ